MQVVARNEHYSVGRCPIDQRSMLMEIVKRSEAFGLLPHVARMN